jgi:hypothetical protein
MVEVFKTNVTKPIHACWLVDYLHRSFVEYKVNFDLTDCDNILRIECVSGDVDSLKVILLLKRLCIEAEALSDELPECYINQAFNIHF